MSLIKLILNYCRTEKTVSSSIFDLIIKTVILIKLITRHPPLTGRFDYFFFRCGMLFRFLVSILFIGSNRSSSTASHLNGWNCYRFRNYFLLFLSWFNISLDSHHLCFRYGFFVKHWLRSLTVCFDGGNPSLSFANLGLLLYFNSFSIKCIYNHQIFSIFIRTHRRRKCFCSVYFY